MSVVNSSLVEQADALLAAGLDDEAVLIISDAARSGDLDAVFTLAHWHVYGHPVPRDFSAARALFHRAGLAGHAASARIYSVFVALGSGGPADWSSAVDLLGLAAQTDGIAARQLELLRAMRLQPNGTPPTLPSIEMVSNSPRLGIIRSLFTEAECDHIIELAKPRMIPSVVVNSSTGIQSPHPIRTSDCAVLGPIQQDLVIHALNVRIAALTGTAEVQGEPVSVLRYSPGQQYRLHHDCLPGEANQRIFTVITYLNSAFGDGGTYFSSLDRTLRPGAGDAVAFWNVLPDGQVDVQSQHSGLPVTDGEKWVCTRWIRQSSFDPWGMRSNL